MTKYSKFSCSIKANVKFPNEQVQYLEQNQMRISWSLLHKCGWCGPWESNGFWCESSVLRIKANWRTETHFGPGKTKKVSYIKIKRSFHLADGNKAKKELDILLVQWWFYSHLVEDLSDALKKTSNINIHGEKVNLRILFFLMILWFCFQVVKQYKQ